MDLGALIPIAGIAMATVVTVRLLGLASKWLDYRRDRAPRNLAEIEQRLSRIEQAVDAIAVETERVSEGQRFVTKLLAERSVTAASENPGGRGA